jgi:4-deoxy-L-threo-5-hexosulose-uronate ketol-isomerase
MFHIVIYSDAVSRSSRLAIPPVNCRSDSMHVRLPYAPDPAGFARMSTSEIRRCFLLQQLFEPGQVRLYQSDLDRAVVGGAVPSAGPLALETPDDLASGIFARRREIGVVNVGDPGLVRVDGKAHQLEYRDALYIGRGGENIEFESGGGSNPPCFYFVSYPAHASYPTVLVRRDEAEAAELGGHATANRRTIRKYLRPGVVETCQLTLGITELEEGSVWNTMPGHRHPRRSEIYLYFELPKDAVVLHCLGEPQETRHVVVRNREAVLAPGWSIHTGAGTCRYSFVWAMGGENREFSDMDHVSMEALA